MSDEAYIKDKSKAQILADLVGTAHPGSPVHEQQKMAIIVRCVEDVEGKIGSLTDVIDAANRSNAELANKLYTLNFTLTAATWVAGIATAIGTVIAFLNLYVQLVKR
jgi:hypothetical protein